MLSKVVHSLLLLPASLICSLLGHLTALLPAVDALVRVTAALTLQEEATGEDMHKQTAGEVLKGAPVGATGALTLQEATGEGRQRGVGEVFKRGAGASDGRSDDPGGGHR